MSKVKKKVVKKKIKWAKETGSIIDSKKVKEELGEIPKDTKIDEPKTFLISKMGITHTKSKKTSP